MTTHTTVARLWDGKNIVRMIALRMHGAAPTIATTARLYTDGEPDLTVPALVTDWVHQAWGGSALLSHEDWVKHFGQTTEIPADALKHRDGLDPLIAVRFADYVPKS